MVIGRFWRVMFSVFSHYPLFWTHPLGKSSKRRDAGNDIYFVSFHIISTTSSAENDDDDVVVVQFGSRRHGANDSSILWARMLLVPESKKGNYDVVTLLLVWGVWKVNTFCHGRVLVYPKVKKKGYEQQRSQQDQVLGRCSRASNVEFVKPRKYKFLS